jgi:ATP-dependent Clp protease adaptor protein ClpS
MNLTVTAHAMGLETPVRQARSVKRFLLQHAKWDCATHAMSHRLSHERGFFPFGPQAFRAPAVGFPPGTDLWRERATNRIRVMSGNDTRSVTKDEIKVERPRLHKVILLNDDYTPREFVVTVLKAEFRISEDQAMRVMITAHKRGACVVAVYTKDVAESKATNATDAGRSNGYPLLFTTEPEE